MNNKRGKLEISFLMDNGIIEQSKSAIYLTLKGVPMVILHDFEALFSYARYYFPVVNRGSRPSMEYHTLLDDAILSNQLNFALFMLSGIFLNKLCL